MIKQIELERLRKGILVIEKSDYHGYFTFLLANIRHYAFPTFSNMEQVINLNYNQLAKDY